MTAVYLSGLKSEYILDAYLFDSLDEVGEVTQEFVDDYNNLRPHDALGGIPPQKYREMKCGSCNHSDGLRFTQATPSLHYAHQNDLKRIVYL